MTLLGVPATFFAIMFFLGVVIAFVGLVANSLADELDKNPPAFLDSWSRTFLRFEIPGVSLVLVLNVLVNIVVWSLLIGSIL